MAARSLHQWLGWVPKIHPETGVQQVKGRWMAATPDDALHTFEGVGEQIISLVDGQRTVGDIAAALQLQFDVAPAECEQQTVQFIEILVQKKVLAP